MKVDELIGIVRAVKIDDNSDLVSGASDKLVLDSVIARLLNQAQIEFCDYTGWLRERGTAAPGLVTLATGTDAYVYDARILRVDSARVDGRNDDLIHVDESILRTYGRPPDPLAFLDGVTPRSAASLTGLPEAYSLDAATRTIRFNRVPTATENGTIVRLRTKMLPLATLSEKAPNASPEIPAQYHYALTYFAAREILLGPNLDSTQRRAGVDAAKQWSDALEEARRRRIEADRRTPVVRFGRW